MDDEELEKVTEKLHTLEENLIGLRNTLKTLSSVEKMRNFVDLEILQQRVSKLRTQQQQRQTECVTELQAEENLNA